MPTVSGVSSFTFKNLSAVRCKISTKTGKPVFFKGSRFRVVRALEKKLNKVKIIKEERLARSILMQANIYAREVHVDQGRPIFGNIYPLTDLKAVKAFSMRNPKAVTSAIVNNDIISWGKKIKLCEKELYGEEVMSDPKLFDLVKKDLIFIIEKQNQLINKSLRNMKEAFTSRAREIRTELVIMRITNNRHLEKLR